MPTPAINANETLEERIARESAIVKKWQDYFASFPKLDTTSTDDELIGYNDWGGFDD